MKMFWSNAPKWVESDATADEPAPHRPRALAAKAALAMSMAIARTRSGVR